MNLVTAPDRSAGSITINESVFCSVNSLTLNRNPDQDGYLYVIRGRELKRLSLAYSAVKSRAVRGSFQEILKSVELNDLNMK